MPVFGGPGQAQQICPAIVGVQILILNLDDTFNLFVGRSSGMGESNALELQPGASTIWDASDATWAFTDSTEPPLIASISPGTSQLNLGPQQLIDILGLATLAVDIAQAIAQTGVSLLAAPTPLYGGTVVPPPAGASLVGATVGYNLYGGTKANGTTEQAAINSLNGFTGRPLGTVVQKIYLSEGQSATGVVRGDYQQIITNGGMLFISAKPAHTASGTYSDSTVTIAGTTCLQEKTNLAAIISAFQAAYVAAGFPANSFMMVPWQEPGAASSPFLPATSGAYQNYFQYYQTAISAAGINRVYNPASGQGELVQSQQYPGDAFVDVILVDYYGEDANVGTTLATAEALADNHLPSPIPFGLGEWNAAASPKTSLATAKGYWNSYFSYILNLFTARLAAGKTNSWIILYEGFSVASKPLVPDQITNISDFKIAGVQQIYDALSVGSTSSSPTIAAGATLIVEPLNPTPGAAFAAAQGISYDISLSLQAGIGSTNPFATVSLEWTNQDIGQAQTVARQRWSCPMGAAAGTIINGVGPQHGQYLRARVTNNDTVACTLINFMVNSSGRSEPRHNWYWDAPISTALPAYTPADGSSFQGVAMGQSWGGSLGSLNQISIPATTKRSWLFSLFAGSVYVRSSGTASGMIQITIHPQPGAVWGQAALLNESPTTEFEDIIIFPRGPCLVTLNNTDSSAHTIDVEIVGLDPI